MNTGGIDLSRFIVRMGSGRNSREYLTVAGRLLLFRQTCPDYGIKTEPLRCLSLTQPWASLMACGAKTVETRSWQAHYRGLVAIHAARTFPKESQALCMEEPFFSALRKRLNVPPSIAGEQLPRGVILAVGRLVEIKTTGATGEAIGWVQALAEQERAFGLYTIGRFGWFFEDVQALAEPVPARGFPGLWEPPADVLAAIERQVSL